jgi:hypothetical protein
VRLDPALTYRGALRLLGKTDSKLVGALDTLLGGLILASPASHFAGLWGMVDQKNEAISLIRKLVDGVAKRMNRVKGFERYELITAAHTVIVIAAFFDTYRRTLDSHRFFVKLELSEREKLSLATGAPPPADAVEAINLLVLPTAHEGFFDVADLVQFYSTLRDATRKFVHGLDVWRDFGGAARRQVEQRMEKVPQAAALKYQSYFVELAKDVPEFFVWATVAGQRKIRQETSSAHSALSAALTEDRESLGRLEEVLKQLSSTFSSEPPKCRTIIARANQAVLAETVVPAEALDQITEISFPTIERVYQRPLFRVANAAHASPSNENWWAQQPIRQDLDLFFASFLASGECVSTPLLLLGHPGAGKSLLTKVLAARLPASGYTAIRVPLRRVDADAPVYEQIQQGLDLATNRRVRWANLADEGDTTRVVFLDGLDELLQASSQSRAAYLQEVAEFQRREADQDRPVAFVVTSRTVVADRVRIGPNTTLVKLEEFTDEQIREWLAVWSACNQKSILCGRMREISLDVVMKHRALARQPLLLMMLAVYAADPKAAPLDAKLSNAAFYARILDNFVRREVGKQEHKAADDEEMSELVEDQMWRLGIAGFAMFNRDRQDIGDEALGRDILALTGEVSSRSVRVGQETIGRFFFVYTAEADAHRRDAQRAYEFLHATFGEYLVAHFSVKVLIEVADGLRQTRRGGREYDDDLLFALLCHQSLTTRGSILNFVDELFIRVSDQGQRACGRALDTLIEQHRNRTDSNAYDAYQPLPVDNVRRLAAYSANLVLLRTILARGRALSPPPDWRSTVELWRAGLGETGWESLCHALDLVDEQVAQRRRPVPANALEIGLHQLRGAMTELAIVQIGMAGDGHAPRQVPGCNCQTFIHLWFGRFSMADHYMTASRATSVSRVFDRH